MTEDTVREFAHIYRDAVKVEGSLEIRKLIGLANDWLRSYVAPDDAAKIIWKYFRRTLDHFHRTNEGRLKNVRGFIFRTAPS